MAQSGFISRATPTSASDPQRTFALSLAYRASLPDVSLPFCFFSALLSQLAHYAAYLRLYP